MTRLTVVVGGQYGSEGKGAVAGFLGRTMSERDLAVRVAGPNAGHTAYDPQGREWKLQCVPVAAVTSPHAQLHIAAGSEVDPQVLMRELFELEGAGHVIQKRLTIHPSATVLMQENIAEESTSGIVGRIGSTGKGIGSARAGRIMRVQPTWEDYAPGALLDHLTGEHGPLNLDGLNHVVIEGTQGYGLGLHTENYPQVTSSDCRAIDFMAMAGISPWEAQLDLGRLRVIVVARVYPIRVAGNSGPMLDETSWDELGLPEELTTVTRKVRRVGAWDPVLLENAIRANGGGDWNPTVVLAITMVDQLFPEMAGVEGIATRRADDPARLWLEGVQDSMCTDIVLIGTGPNTMFRADI